MYGSNDTHRHTRLTALLLATMLLLLLSPISAEVPLPQIPPAKGEQCVEPTDIIRKNHMLFLDVHRDDTVIEGIRTKQHSLVGCINCHVTPRADGSLPRISDSDHFCSTCHQYAAVQIDCFQCHSDRPQQETAWFKRRHAHSGFNTGTVFDTGAFQIFVTNPKAND